MTKQKRKSKAGFTLVEMLCALVVMVLVSCLMAVGVRVAVKAYQTEVMHSEAQVLCSTIRTKVNDELRYAGSIYLTTNGEFSSFFSQNCGDKAYYSTNADGQVILTSGTGDHKILPAKSYPYGMKASVEITNYNTTTRIFTVYVQVTESDGTTVLSDSTFQVKQLNKPASTNGS